jgi:cellulose synthase/poly-beta-1,6-N-acetylglucosamine synthase-like glycosyltransferase
VIERAAAALVAWLDAVHVLWSSYGGLQWLLWFAPAVVFLELPRYYLPLLWAVLVRVRDLVWRREPVPKPVLRRRPLVSVVVAGLNEEEIIAKAVRSLLDQDYPYLEIIVVDDHSTDRTSEEVRPFLVDPRVRLVRNNAERGRGGRPSGSNFGLRLARGEFLVSLDADTTFDRHLVTKLIEPFADPTVGVVAGNVLIRNWRESLVARLQALEYAIAIDINKRWTDARDATLQASGAVGAFRRQAVKDIGGWEQQLGEDTDVSLRMIKAGWKLRFAPDAVARTECPSKLKQVMKQRFRWDRGGMRAFFKKHYRLLDPRVAGFWFAFELFTEFFFAVVATIVYPIYVVCMLWTNPAVAMFVLLVANVAYSLLSVLSVAAVAICTPRIEKPWALLGAAVVNPLYKEVLRWVRFRATVCELLRIRYEDTFLPMSAWVHAKRY